MQEATYHRRNKGDIVNRLVERFGLRSYLEYNKLDGATYYEDIKCEHKEIAYLPENSYLDANSIKRLLDVASNVQLDNMLSVPDLLQRYDGKKFDILFFDPVHVRPDVDMALKKLPKLLNPGGFLVVHDCNPELIAQTSLVRRPGRSWVGETYKAFAVFRAHNMGKAITVSEDFGVGIIWNTDLNLDYSIDSDFDYRQFSLNREGYIGLMNYQTFLDRTEERIPDNLFLQSETCPPAHFLPKTLSGNSAGRSDSSALHIPPVNRDVPASTKVAHAQLFWRRKGSGFEEENSSEMPLYFDGVRQELNFCFPDEAEELAQLRFDFSDCVGTVQLCAIRIRNTEKKVIWEWLGEGTVPGVVANVDCHEIRNGKNQFLLYSATSGDPRIFLEIPEREIGDVRGGWVFEVEIIPQMETVHMVVAELKDYKSDLLELEKNLMERIALVVEENEKIKEDMRTLEQRIVQELLVLICTENRST